MTPGHGNPSGRIREVHLVASGDLRLAANQAGWPAQQALEEALGRALAAEGVTVVRAHAFDPDEGHGFISSQRMGMDVFQHVPTGAAVVVAEAVWQYSHHVLAGLRAHRGPILTVANWSGTWPGLVGLLNLNGSLTKAGVPYSSLWSERFEDAAFLRGLREWLDTGRVTHDESHVRPLNAAALPPQAVELGRQVAADLKARMVIIGVFDEGCMGMYNAIIDDEYLNPLGIYKERLSQSALVAAMRGVPEAEARAALTWLRGRGMRFDFGSDPTTDLTEEQVLEQLKMYVAVVRMAHAFGLDAVGIQYQQGLKDMVAASDLVEGLLNNVDRPPVRHAATGEELYAGQALPHFNEVDEGAAVDALVTNRVWRRLGFDEANTLHDLRWGERFAADDLDAFVWVLEISGAVPASHLRGGYGGATGLRQPAVFFPRGGSTLSGVGKAGELVWSRVYLMGGRLHVDLGRGRGVDLPDAETERRRAATNPEWPILHAVLDGVTRDQMMARHRANHLQVAYAPTANDADLALAAKAAAFDELGLAVHLCGQVGVD
ncbi:MAG: fucose isomerase [Trueperaceae bacterium]|nr:fucose isomerase [Trueperaceae bacterium]MCC6310297.1 fucose isomerase [Trueperaceae bacterium]MCO5173297.1 fucose isomerase [Trueperaceae bacterium]MCW5818746.1 fucose isomerase [Trueperaceae bacterium]